VKFRLRVSPLSVLLIAGVNSQVSLLVGPARCFSLPFGKGYIGSKTPVKEKRINAIQKLYSELKRDHGSLCLCTGGAPPHAVLLQHLPDGEPICSLLHGFTPAAAEQA